MLFKILLSHSRTKILIKRCCLLFAILSTTAMIMGACKGGEITDFFEAINRYGYKSTEPLGVKNVKVDTMLMGGYVYNSVPVIISRKDPYTYLVKFLSIELDVADVEVEAHMTLINGSKYLNLNLGHDFAFLQVGNNVDNMLEIKLLRNTISPYVKNEDLKGWLQKNGNNEEYTTSEDYEITIWYTFIFEKVSIQKALQVQAVELEKRRTELFEGCYTYFTYNELEKKYPGDPLLKTARENIFSACKTIDEFNEYILHFPDDPLCEKARIRIKEIMVYKNDSTNYNIALAANDIRDYLSFIDKCKTPAFKDSAQQKTGILADGITVESIEWKWTSGERKEALQLIYNKIDYSKNEIELAWYQEHIALYCLSIADIGTTEIGMSYLDKLVERKPERNILLDMYISKGFMLWSMENTEQAIEVFRLKINDIYDGTEAIPFKKALATRYQSYKDQGLVFPDEKKTWKRIKKL
jgi:hypothetical protein